jgi:hypothetical protein
MSMHDLEDVTELFVKEIANSDLPTLKKRTLIYKVFEFRDHGDCGFTNLRTINEMVGCKYSFLFKKDEMYDYNERKEFYDAFKNNSYREDGDVYIYWNGDAYDESIVCVDTNTKGWEGMVTQGLISGEGSEKILEMNFIDALKEISIVLKKYNVDSLSKLFSEEELKKIKSMNIDEQTEKMTSEQIENISKVLKPETIEKYMELEQEYIFIMNGLYLCAVLTGIDDEMTENDFHQVFGTDKETLENMLGV